MSCRRYCQRRTCSAYKSFESFLCRYSLRVLLNLRFRAHRPRRTLRRIGACMRQPVPFRLADRKQRTARFFRPAKSISGLHARVNLQSVRMSVLFSFLWGTAIVGAITYCSPSLCPSLCLSVPPRLPASWWAVYEQCKDCLKVTSNQCDIAASQLKTLASK